ncbi:MAG: restriction endonuclease-like protein [Dehalobacterium sp.]
MDSPPIGCNPQELIYIQTSTFELTIKGKPCHPKAEMLGRPGQSCFSVWSNEPFELYSWASQETISCPFGAGRHDIQMVPMFFEHQDIEMILEKKREIELTFCHESPLFQNKITPVGRSGKTMSGVINFGCEVGFSNLIFKVDGLEVLSITLEVFPSKIDYRNDYLAILRDVNDEIHNLAYDFLKRTYLWSGLRDEYGNSQTEFYSILKTIFQRFLQSTDVVLRAPYHVLQQNMEIVPPHRAKQITNATLRYIEKHQQSSCFQNRHFIPQKVLSVRKQMSFDTFENRMVKHMLLSVIRRLEQLRIQSKGRGETLFNQLSEMIIQLRRRVDNSFLREVGNLYASNALSLVFHAAPGYRELYKYYLMLFKGIALTGDLFRISIKDLAILYEYWCFIKLGSLLREKHEMIQQDLLRVDHNGLFVTIKKGRRAQMRYRNKRNGEVYTLAYNPRYPAIPPQRPDNVLCLEKRQSDVQYQYVFDAKYRINPALEGTGYHSQYGQPGPEEDDINAMHRYRDAIVAEQDAQLRRNLFGAYVLFPYNNEVLYRNHRMYKSIEKVNIGGLPFLPGTIGLVQGMIDCLIDNSPKSVLDTSILPGGIEESWQEIDFNIKDVLIGALRGPEQLDVCLRCGFYHIPYKRLNKERIGVRFIALYQSKELFGDSAGISYFGEILKWEVLPRRQISEIPSILDELYIKYTIREWVKRDKLIQPKEYGVRSHLYTNFKIFERAELIPELCIRSATEYRLYLELKRITDQIGMKVNRDQVQNFAIEDRQIWVEDGNLIIAKDGGIKIIRVQDFIKRPGAIVRSICKFQ